MMLLDPGGNAAGIVALWQTASDHFGWIVASTPAIMNGTDSSQILQHLLALQDAVAETWFVDRHAVILEGFSGGGCAAYRQVLMRPDLFRGAIVECGHMGPYLDLQDRIRPGSCFFLVTRSQDFNAQHMRDLAKVLEGCGETVKFIELLGGHEPIRGAEADDALRWINSMIK
jgi:predicted esterase